MVVIACGALAKEIIALQKLNHWNFDLRCIPASIHNHPEQIPKKVEEKIIEAQSQGHEVFIAFADCGTGGQLDSLIERYGVTRLPGAHCYEFYATADIFKQLQDEELGTFYLTDFLARHFDALILEGMGINKYPELQEMYFAHYKRLIYLAQNNNPELLERAKAAAKRLGLEFELRYTGFGQLASSLQMLSEPPQSSLTERVR